MKKIVELEDRWRAYKYKTIIFYIFIIVLVTFIIFVGFFIKFQYDKYTTKNNAIKYSKQIQKEKYLANNVANSNIADSNTLQNNSNDVNLGLQSSKTLPVVDFICRQVIVDKLTVRKEASFKSQPLGYYENNAIFCAKNKKVNGLLKTNNGWVSANDAFSQIVEVNMFVDSGFYKSPSNNQRVVTKAPIDEIKVFENTPTQYATSSNNSSQNRNMAQNIANPVANVEEAKPKPVINISSEKITKEKEIELKQLDFKQTNNYDTAIEIADYYYKAKDYKNSIKWSLNASGSNSKDKPKTQSWIIYAKSLYATGKKEQAIEVLNRYISNTNSRDAIDALNNMKQGVI